MGLIPLLFIRLIPTRPQVSEIQKCIAYMTMLDSNTDYDQLVKDYETLNPDTAFRMAINRPEKKDEKNVTTQSVN